jgi:uncharacterized membrane protein YeaQ/YmgE (transglycosylase-associated protein family)
MKLAGRGMRPANPFRKDLHMIGFLLIIVVGAVIGWLASIVMRRDAQQGILVNIVVGIVGALLAGVLLTPFLGGAPITAGALDLRSIFVSFLGALVLLAIVNLFNRGRVR